MQTVKSLSKILFLILISGCQGFPPIEDQPQCSVYMEEIEIDGRLYVDLAESACFCRSYRWSKEYVGPVGTTEELSLLECQKLVGHPPDAYLEVSQWYEKIRSQANKKQARNK